MFYLKHSKIERFHLQHYMQYKDWKSPTEYLLWVGWNICLGTVVGGGGEGEWKLVFRSIFILFHWKKLDEAEKWKIEIKLKKKLDDLLLPWMDGWMW